MDKCYFLLRQYALDDRVDGVSHTMKHTFSVYCYLLKERQKNRTPATNKTLLCDICGRCCLSHIGLISQNLSAVDGEYVFHLIFASEVKPEYANLLSW